MEPTETAARLSRRRFTSYVLTAATGLAASACSRIDNTETPYQAAVHQTWRHAPPGPLRDGGLPLRELVRYATLAASSHNTQCWRFRVEERAIEILPDLNRRCPVVDPDDHHLFASLGCAAENLVQAALAHGQHGEVSFRPVDGGRLQVMLEPTRAAASPLFQAIVQRQCTRAEFDGRPLSAAELRALARAGCGGRGQVVLLTARPAIEQVLDHVVQANTVQMADRAFKAELKQWIRFSEAEALRSRDGLFARTSGNPVVPRWLGSRLFDLVFSAARENDKYSRQIRSSSGIAVFFSPGTGPSDWIDAGRCYQRFALQATALGLRHAFVNQPVEVPEQRAAFATALGIGHARPDLVVRFGRGPDMPRSLRRPVEAVLV